MTYDPNNKWEVEAPDTAEDCSFCEDEKRVFVISPEVLATMRVLCKEIKHEWQILLKGEETDAGINVTGYYIPKQEITPSTVTNNDMITAEFVKEHGIIGTCHSHSGMGVYFSNVDDEHTNSSMLKHHIVTNNKGEFKAISRVELPCGMNKFLDAVVLQPVPSVTKEDIEGFDNITKKEYKVTYHAGGSFYGTSKYQGQALNYKRGSRRNHAFYYDQENYNGGFCNAD